MTEPGPGVAQTPAAAYMRFMLSRYAFGIFGVLALAAAAYAYEPGLFGSFALDDYTNVVDNGAIALHDLSWSSLSHAMFSFQAGPAMRPLSMLSFALNAYFTGTADAFAFKTTNLVIHACNGLLVLLLLRRLLRAYRERLAPAAEPARLEWLAWLSAGFWLLHPLNAMPVLYVVQRETELSSLCMLIGLQLYVTGRMRGGSAGAWMVWLGVPALTVLAILCKESGALLLVYALVLEFFVFRFRRPDGTMQRDIAGFYVLFLLLPGSLGLCWALFAHGGSVLDYSGRDFTLGERLLTETRVVWDYIRWTVFPDPRALGLYHDDIQPSRGLLQPATTLFATLGVAGLVTACLIWRQRWPLAALGVAWFLGGQLMESTIFPLELVFEHRCYLPDLGLILAVLSLLLPMCGDAAWRAVRYAVVVVALALCTTMTWMRAYDWRDNLDFAAAEARHHPESPYATYMLGQTYANLALMEDSNQYDNAVATLRAASVVPHSTVIADVSLVLVEAQIKGAIDPDVMPRIAAKLSDRKIAASDIQGLSALGDCVDKGNCKVKAADMQAIFHSALADPYLAQLKDTHANILVIYGNYESIMDRDYEKARALMAEAAALVPNEPQYRENLVTMDISLQDAARAKLDLQALQRLDYFGHLDQVIEGFQKQVSGLHPPR
ncbi:MAG TPA: hypothetical protein VGH91_08100 [Gammaproteobacteria bacterium]|jgi:hypothetical protein